MPTNDLKPMSLLQGTWAARSFNTLISSRQHEVLYVVVKLNGFLNTQKDVAGVYATTTNTVKGGSSSAGEGSCGSASW